MYNPITYKLADFKDQLQNRESILTLWAELHIALAPSIILL